MKPSEQIKPACSRLLAILKESAPQLDDAFEKAMAQADYAEAAAKFRVTCAIVFNGDDGSVEVTAGCSVPFKRSAKWHPNDPNQTNLNLEEVDDED